MGGMKTVDFFFDFISPYGWLAARQLESFPPGLATIRYRPVLLAGLLHAHENKGPAEIPAKRVYTFTDVARWAHHLGLPYEGPPAHPFNPLLALRTCYAVKEDEARARFAKRLLIAVWEEGKDVTSPSTIETLATECKFDAKALLTAAGSPEVKEGLKLQTQEAIRKGVFGVPSFCVDDEFFWGSDRLPFLKAYLSGDLSIDKNALEKRLARPRAADRRI